jgi:hypothetical protein
MSDELVIVNVHNGGNFAEPRIMAKSDAVQLCPSCRVEWTSDAQLEIARLRKALAFYANSANYRGFFGEPAPINDDGGALAHAALAPQA